MSNLAFLFPREALHTVAREVNHGNHLVTAGNYNFEFFFLLLLLRLVLRVIVVGQLARPAGNVTAQVTVVPTLCVPSGLKRFEKFEQDI
jgi:hypothetical protein